MNSRFLLTLALIVSPLSLFSLSSPVPPSLPSSSFVFQQIANPSAANQTVDFHNLPCFTAYTALQSAIESTLPSTNSFITQAQQPNTLPTIINSSFLNTQQQLLSQATKYVQQAEKTSFNN